MRYYRITITNDDGTLFQAWTSLRTDGTWNPAAQAVELDVPIARYAEPAGRGYLKIWGVPLQQITNSFDLNGKNIAIEAGFSAGLPLANPKQAGLLVKGQVYQAFGNWQGIEQSLDLIFQPGGTGTNADPANHTLNWQPNTPLSGAIQTMLKTAYPDAKITINISPNLVQGDAQPSSYATLNQMSVYLEARSRAILKQDGYTGVQIAYNGNEITVSDGTVDPKPTPIEFYELIGQPTWIGPQEIQAQVAMRHDLALFDIVTLPPTVATQSEASLQRFNNKLSFSGNYSITAIRHVGNSRQPDAASWNTTLNLIPIPKKSS